MPSFVVISLPFSMFAVALLLVSPVYAHEDDNQGAVAEDGRFTPNAPGAVFPPQPREVQNVVQFNTKEFLQNAASADAPVQAQPPKPLRVENPVAQAEADINVTGELGARYTHLSTQLRQGKWGAGNDHQLIVFYSYSFDQTIRVILREGQIKSVTAVAAVVDQPALNEAEMAEAIALARTYWVEQGNERIGSLTGYAIQTFQENGAPYPVRMAYVSFHQATAEPPVLANLVDLSAQQVGRSEEAE